MGRPKGSIKTPGSGRKPGSTNKRLGVLNAYYERQVTERAIRHRKYRVGATNAVIALLVGRISQCLLLDDPGINTILEINQVLTEELLRSFPLYLYPYIRVNDLTIECEVHRIVRKALIQIENCETIICPTCKRPQTYSQRIDNEENNTDEPDLS